MSDYLNLQSDISHSLTLLRNLRDHWSDLDYMQDNFSLFSFSGVCYCARLIMSQQIDDVCKEVIARWPEIHKDEENPEGDLRYPIGGKEEYRSHYTQMWNNPKRLAFINYMIEELTKELRMLPFKFKSAPRRDARDYGLNFPSIIMSGE